MNSEYLITIDNFEGPLDILLSLVKDKEIDILTIDISKITTQYLTYLTKMSHLNLEIAADYLVMAAYLVQLKSKLLLPKPTIFTNEVDPEIERQLLISRILEYRQIKKIVPILHNKEIDRTKFLQKMPNSLNIFADSEIEINKFYKFNISQMLKSLNRMIARVALTSPVESARTTQQISPQQRASEIMDYLKINSNSKWVTFESLFSESNGTIYIIVITFLAILSLISTQQIIVAQDKETLEIYIRTDEINNEKQI